MHHLLVLTYARKEPSLCCHKIAKYAAEFAEQRPREGPLFMQEIGHRARRDATVLRELLLCEALLLHHAPKVARKALLQLCDLSISRCFHHS